MSIRVDPKITIYSDCTRCCPRFLRVWLCCCCKVDPDEVERVNEIAEKALSPDPRNTSADKPNESHKGSHGHHKKKHKNSKEPI